MYEKLKQHRESAGLSQSDMAERLGFSRSFYTQLENGSRRMPLPTAQRIAAIIGTKLNWPVKMSWLDEIFFTPDVAERDNTGAGDTHA